MKCFCCLEKPRKFAEFKKYLTHYLCSFRIYQIYFNKNKNTLSGPANRKKQLDIMPTYHYVQNQGKVMTQSQENGQMGNWQFFDDFEVKYLEIANISDK